jgi:hypothetical protein
MNTEDQSLKFKNSDDNFIKITISKESENAAMEIVDKVNSGFEAGKVNRQDVVSWIIMRFKGQFGLEEIKTIRASFANEITLLESIFKKAKETGVMPNQLKEALRDYLVNDSSQKRKKTSLTQKSINDGNTECDDMKEAA